MREKSKKTETVRAAEEISDFGLGGVADMRRQLKEMDSPGEVSRGEGEVSREGEHAKEAAPPVSKGPAVPISSSGKGGVGCRKISSISVMMMHLQEGLTTLIIRKEHRTLRLGKLTVLSECSRREC